MAHGVLYGALDGAVNDPLNVAPGVENVMGCFRGEA